MNGRTALSAALLGGVDLAVLTVALPNLPHLAGRLEHPNAWVGEVGADAATIELAGAALWVAAAWLALGLLALCAAALPGGAGGRARRVSRVVLPATVYRLLVGVAGVGIALQPGVATAATAAPTAAAPAVSAELSAAGAAAKPPPPVWPSDGKPTRPAPTRPPAPRQQSRAASVVVQPGDSLWSISRAHLPTSASDARVVRTWPRWYAANRRTVGADPNLIRPGQVLHAPSSRAPGATEENSP